MLLRRFVASSGSICLRQRPTLHSSSIYYNSETAPAKSLYQILKVSTDASPEEIKKKYLSLAKRYHPDTAPNDKSLADKFKEIAEAYRVLSDPKRREQYDIENKIINPQQAMYEKVNPEFRNDDVYANWMADRTKSKRTDEDQDLADYFREKYFKQDMDALDPKIHTLSFGEATGTVPKNLENSSLLYKVVYDFRFILVGGFILMSLATFGEALYQVNKERKKVKRMGEFKEGKGIIVKLTPFNPV